MILLIKKDCVFCDSVKDLDAKFPNINKFFVENGLININGNFMPLDPRIPALPALITDKTVYCGEKYILDFLKNKKED